MNSHCLRQLNAITHFNVLIVSLIRLNSHRNFQMWQHLHSAHVLKVTLRRLAVQVSSEYAGVFQRYAQKFTHKHVQTSGRQLFTLNTQMQE